MACSLIEHKRIETTVAKARELRRFVEPILTKAKTDSTHSRRVIFSYLQNKEILKELFGTVSEKIAHRPGGYTRIIKLGNRQGDNADMALIELVDFNELMLTEAKPAKAKTRRSRRGSGEGAAGAPVAAAPVAVVTEEVAAAPVADVEEVVAEEPVAEVIEEVVAEAPVAEVAAEEVAVADVTETPADEAPEAPEASAEGEEEKA
jgi:large subunit ribosomal protein L17